MLGPLRWSHLVLFLYAYLLGWGAGGAWSAVTRFIAELGGPRALFLVLAYSHTALRLFVFGFCGCWFLGGDWRKTAFCCGALALAGEFFFHHSLSHLLVGALACAAGAWTLARQGRSERLGDFRQLLLSPFSQRS